MPLRRTEKAEGKYVWGPPWKGKKSDVVLSLWLALPSSPNTICSLRLSWEFRRGIFLLRQLVTFYFVWVRESIELEHAIFLALWKREYPDNGWLHFFLQPLDRDNLARERWTQCSAGTQVKSAPRIFFILRCWEISVHLRSWRVLSSRSSIVRNSVFIGAELWRSSVPSFFD